jgi:peptide subunit release factor RF-3
VSGDNAARLTAMKKRSKGAIRTVSTSDVGRAACAENLTLFDRVANNDGKVHPRDQGEAASICDGCPVNSGCGFRVAHPGPKRGEP